MRSATRAMMVGVLALAAGRAFGVGPASNAEEPVKPAQVEPIAPHDRPVIQLALLLDTSNSMDGLIDQARASLWAIVNELSGARHDGETPDLQVALFEYGNNGASVNDGYVRLRMNFSSDLDLVSEQIFGLRTNGGEEYCGRVIHEANRTLRWWAERGEDGDEAAVSTSLGEAVAGAVKAGIEGEPPALAFTEVGGPVVKVMVIAGNEPFTQGTMHYRSAIGEARGHGVTLNTVFCGDRATGSRTKWEDGARLGGGLYASIDSDRSVVEPPTPFDVRLGELNEQLNSTYLPYGARGAGMARRQMEQDALNDQAGMAPARVASKAAPQYDQSHWDLVDAVEEGGVELSDLDELALPESLRGLSEEAQIRKVNEARAERESVRTKILEVSAERAKFLAEWREKRAEGPATLNDALVAALRGQVAAAGYTFDE